MLITTNNTRLQKILAGVCLCMPDGSGYSTDANTVAQLSNLATVLTTDYPGEWDVSFTDQQPVAWGYADLTESLDDHDSQAFILAPGAIGADSIDLEHFVENVYSQPVTTSNWQRVLQLFRLWYACEHPDEYQNPPGVTPAKYAALSLAETPEARKERNRRLQSNRTERLKAAANRVGSDTIDRLAAALLAASDNQIAAIKDALTGKN